MKKLLLLLLFIPFLFFNSCSKTEQKKSPIKSLEINKHPYWGKLYSSSLSSIYNDTIILPIQLDLSIFIDDILDLQTNKSDFMSKLKLRLWSRYNEKEILTSNDTIDLSPSALIDFDFKNSDNLFFTNWDWDGYYEDIKRFRYVSEIENKFYHKWDLRKYPFDKQKVRFTFTSKNDTSFVRLNKSEKFNSYVNKDLYNLKDGFVIDTIIFKEEFVKSEIIEPFDSGLYDYQGGIERNEVRSRGVFEVVISRDGSWLFIKLFLGSFLSLILSWFIFLIPTKEFDAMAQLSVGAIFGAVGNKYFVDSAIASQVLTTADLINNTIITLVILNVLVIIFQKNRMFKNQFFNVPKNTMKLSITLFLISMIFIYLYT